MAFGGVCLPCHHGGANRRRIEARVKCWTAGPLRLPALRAHHVRTSRAVARAALSFPITPPSGPDVSCRCGWARRPLPADRSALFYRGAMDGSTSLRRGAEAQTHRGPPRDPSPAPLAGPGGLHRAVRRGTNLDGRPRRSCPAGRNWWGEAFPVVTVRVYKLAAVPRWATTLRRGRVHVEVDPPPLHPRRSLASIRRTRGPLAWTPRMAELAVRGRRWPRGSATCCSPVRPASGWSHHDAAHPSCRHAARHGAWIPSRGSTPRTAGGRWTLRAAADSIRGRFSPERGSGHDRCRPRAACERADPALRLTVPIRGWSAAARDPDGGIAPRHGHHPWSIRSRRPRGGVDLKRRLNFSSRRACVEV